MQVNFRNNLNKVLGLVASHELLTGYCQLLPFSLLSSKDFEYGNIWCGRAHPPQCILRSTVLGNNFPWAPSFAPDNTFQSASKNTQQWLRCSLSLFDCLWSAFTEKKWTQKEHKSESFRLPQRNYSVCEFLFLEEDQYFLKVSPVRLSRCQAYCKSPSACSSTAPTGRTGAENYLRTSFRAQSLPKHEGDALHDL